MCRSYSDEEWIKIRELRETISNNYDKSTQFLGIAIISLAFIIGFTTGYFFGLWR